MKTTITLTTPKQINQVLKSLISLIKGNSQLQQHITNQGIWFENLATETVAAFKQLLHELQYSAYVSTDASVHLLVANNDVDGLLKILWRVLRSRSDLSKALWARGVSLDNLTADQANDLKKLLEANSATVTITNSPVQYQVSGKIRWSDDRPWQESGHRLQADDVVSATAVVPLGTPTAPNPDGRYSLRYNWTSTQGRNGPNLRVRLLNSEGTVVAEAMKPFADRQEILDLQVKIPAPPVRHTLFGTVIDAASGNPVNDAQVVVLFHSGGQPLGSETITTLSTGEFSVPLEAKLWAARPSGQPVSVSFQVSQNGQPLATETRIPDLQPQDQAITVRVTLPSVEPEQPFIVQGTISLADSTALAGVLVRAFDRDMRSEEFLGEQAADRDGFYMIFYYASQFKRAEKGSADLLVRVYDGNGQELAASDILFNAPPEATIDVTVPASVYQGASEWERHHEEIAPLREAVPVHEVTDEDLDFLSRETDIPLEQLSFLRQDDQWAETHGIAPAVFYGLLRQGLPMVLRALLAERPGRKREAMEVALAANQVPGALADQLEQILASLQDLGVALAFAAPEEEGAAPSLGTILGTSMLTTAAQADIVRFILNYEGKAPLWEALLAQAELSQADLGELRFTLESSTLLGHHLPALQMVQGLKQNMNWSTARDLAGFDRKQWQTALGNIPTADWPNGVESPEDWADAIATQIEQAYPTAVVASRLASGTDLSSPDLNFFFAANPDFSLLHSSVDSFLDNGAQVGQVTDLAGMAGHLKTLQRLARVTPDRRRYELMEGLWQQGYTSAIAIANTDRDTFIGQMTPIAGGAAAEEMLGTARLRSDEAQLNLLIAGDLIQYNPRVIPSLLPDLGRIEIPGLNPNDPAPTQPSSELPDWVRLFGSLSTCACRHCRSVYSPAAYLVDLLQFLQQAPRTFSGLNLLEGVLRPRRPDIEHLLLNCENANTPLPYIDLVNEILERAVAGSTADSFPQTEGSAGLLRAMPDHELPAAYSILAEAYFPWQLPFHMGHEHVRLWTEQLELGLGKLYRLFGRSLAEAARMELWLAPGQWALISTEETYTAELFRLWGLDAGPWREEVPVILQRTNLSYAELEALLGTSFLSGYELEPDKSADPCRIELHRLPQPPDEALDRMHRFLRLRNALGWTIQELDEVLSLLETTALDEDALIALADTVSLARKMGAKPAEAAALCASTADELPVRLARVLAAPVREAVLFIRWLNMDWPALGAGERNRPATLLRLLGRWEAWQAAGADAFELNYLLRHEDMVPAVFEPLPAEVERVLRNLHRAAQELRGSRPEAASELEELILIQLAEGLGNQPAIMALLLQPVTNVAGDVVTPAMLSAESGEAAISDWLSFATVEALTDELIAQAQNWWLRLHKAVRIIAGLGLNAEELAAIRDCGSGFWNFNALPIAEGDPNLPYEAWEHLARAKQLGALLPNAGAGFFRFLALARDESTTRNTLLAALSADSGWDVGPSTGEAAELVLPLANALWPGEDILPFRQVEAYERLHQAVQWARRYGIAAETLALWAATELSTEVGIEAVVDSLRSASRQRFASEPAWHQAITPAMDSLRERKRDALVAYLLVNPALSEGPDGELLPQWRTKEGLYAHFLIDVEMSACQLTSRIVEATNAIQLLVQRLRMSLEPGALLGEGAADPHWQQWEWMKNYRLWEANRKVFLYPENWIEPDLRDNKSPFFEELESELLQVEVNEQNVEQAYRSYFTKLSDVARLDIRGLYEEELPNDHGRVLHVFGRTYSEPHLYYYRKRLPSRVWTAWELVEAGISGNHLIPVVRNSQLMLFWATFQEEENTESTGAVSSRLWNIQMQWSLHRNGQWEAPKSEHTPFSANIEVPYAQLAAIDKNISFRVLNNGTDTLDIGLFFDIDWASSRMGARSAASEYIKRFVSLAIFSLDACKQELVFKPASPHVFLLPAYMGQLSMEVYQQGYTRNRFSRNEAFQLSIGYRGAEPVDIGGFTDVWDERLLPSEEIVRLGRSSGLPSLGWSRESVILEAFSLLPSSRICLQASSQDVVLQHLNRPFFLSHQDEGRHYLISPLTELVVEERHTAGGFEWDIDNPFGGPRNTVLPRDRQFNLRYEHRYQFETFYHPFLCAMLERFNNEGLGGLLKAGQLDTKLHRQLHREGQAYYEDTGALRSDLRFTPRFEQYQPTELVWQNASDSYNPYPYEQFDFSVDGAYALYNWELFFHAPLLVADRLSKNQRFEEAQRWFHYIFDPTDFSVYDAPAKYWQIKPLFELAQAWSEGSPPETLEEMMRLLNTGSAEQRQKLQAWREDPFNPHLIARVRLIAYMKTVVQKYLDNLIAWGDQLFRQDTMESINEARQLYMLAAHILGPRPVQVAQPERSPLTYMQMADRLDAFSNVLVELESGLPPSSRPGAERARSPRLSLYFCIPFNDKLLGYWDTVADRLFKIRQCLDLEGQARQLALFAPPIDPALLVRARSAGLDLGEVVGGLSAASLSSYRYSLLAKKAVEFCGEVKALGGALLSALEKKDGEALALMQSLHEIAMLKRMTDLKDLQIKEAEETLRGLQASRLVVEEKQGFYSSREYMNEQEESEIELLKESKLFLTVAKQFEKGASVVAYIPEFKKGAPFTTGASFGGKQLSTVLKSFADELKYFVDSYSFEASMAKISGSYDRRQDDWDFQARLAERELAQIDRQILAAEIRRDIAIKDKANHLEQVRQTEEVERFMRSKFTNAQLYSWMSAQLSALHYQAYKLAFDLAQKAERAARFELGLEAADFSFIQFGHWDSQRKGLLAGERLQQDLRRMDQAYLDRNRREHELTKHISLLQLNPLALIELKETGTCKFSLPEVLFDLDHPGHYLRRIKSVSLSIPCVAGPYTGINAKLTLETNRMRTDAGAGGGYAEGDDDSRFASSYAATQSIATSSAQNDSGLFELNFRDERYLPFEGAGAISEWRLELSGKWGEHDFSQFDFDTIADVVLHLRYTARDGGDVLSDTAIANLQTGLNSLVEASGEEGLFRTFSLRHEFAEAWQQFQRAADAPLRIELMQERFPFFARGRVSIQAFALYLPGETTGRSLPSIDTAGWPIVLDIPADGLRGQRDGILVCRYRIEV